MNRYSPFRNKTEEEIKEIKEKQRKAKLGKKMSEESKRKNSEAHKGKKKSEDTRRKMSEATKGKTYEERYGDKAKEIKQKQIETMRKNKTIKGWTCKLGNTEAEKEFAKKHPDFIPQKAFGTGKGGLKKWGHKHIRCDFYDPTTNTVYEIDGSNHNNIKIQENDKIKDLIYKDLGLNVIHIKSDR